MGQTETFKTAKARQIVGLFVIQIINTVATNVAYMMTPPASVARMSCMSTFKSMLRSLTTAAVITAITDGSNGTHRHQLPKGMATISTINAIAAPTAKCWYLSLAMALSHAMIFFIVSI